MSFTAKGAPDEGAPNGQDAEGRALARLPQFILVTRRRAAQTVARQIPIHRPLERALLHPSNAALGPGATGCLRIVGYRRNRGPHHRRWLRIRRCHLRSDRSGCEQGGGAKNGKDRLHMTSVRLNELAVAFPQVACLLLFSGTPIERLKKRPRSGLAGNSEAR